MRSGAAGGDVSWMQDERWRMQGLGHTFPSWPRYSNFASLQIQMVSVPWSYLVVGIGQSAYAWEDSSRAAERRTERFNIVFGARGCKINDMPWYLYKSDPGSAQIACRKKVAQSVEGLGSGGEP